MEDFPALGQCLIDTGLARLRVIARMWGLKIKATRQVESAMELARELADPSNAAHVWEGLCENERVALSALLEAGGFMPAAVFDRRFGPIRPIGPGRLEREEPWRDPISVTEGLWYRGLIYEGFARGDRESYSAFFVPVELQSALPVKVDAARLEPKVPSVPAPRHPACGGGFLLDDLTTVLAFIHNHHVRVNAENWVWPNHTRSALAPQIRDKDPARLELCLHLLQQLGWIKQNEDGRLRLVPESVMAWLQQPEVESRDQLVNAWRQLADWNELWSLTHLEPDAAGTWRVDPELARNALIRHLAALHPGEWVRVTDFVATIKAIDPDFLRPAGKYDEWYVRDSESGKYLSGFENWDSVEGALLHAMLHGPAWWLGLVKIGSATADGSADVFCSLMTSKADADCRPVPGEKPVARPDLTISIPACRRFDRFQLSRVADLIRIGDTYTYRITAASLRRANQQRIGMDKVLDFLRNLSEAPLPDSVQFCLKQWYENDTQAWIARVVLLRVANEDAMQRIMAAPRVARLVAQTLNPTTAVVAEKDWPALFAALAELGFVSDLIDLGQ
jgi:hypothetical protein